MKSGDGDSLLRFAFGDVAVPGGIVRLERALADVLGQHHYPGPAAGLLGEALAASALLAATLKFAGALSLQARSAGSVQLLFAECGHDQRLRGYARVAEGAHATGFGAMLDGGTLAITITPEQGQRYQGIVPLEHPGLDACIEAYFEQSEQLPTLIRLVSDGVRAAGLMLQVLPGGRADDPRWEHLQQLSATVRADELLEDVFEGLLWKLFHQEKVHLQPPVPLAFGCRCSEQRAAATLQSVGEAEARDVLAEQGLVKVQCEFCQQEYRFDGPALDTLFGPAGAGSTRH